MPIRSDSLILLAAAALSCGTPATDSKPGSVPIAARDGISPDSIRAHAAALSSDSYQGRLPGTLGDTLATAYITAAFQRLGLEPGMPGGSWRQTVPFWNAASTFSVTMAAGGRKAELKDSATAIVFESSPQPEVAIDDQQIIFAGYGIDGAEVGWRDYKTPVGGHIAMALYGEPSRPDPNNPGKADTTFFLGDEVGWYGFINHKFEAAEANGATALLLVVDEKTSGIPWSALQSYSRDRTHLKPDPRYPKQIANLFFINRIAAEKIFRLAGKTYDDMVKAANDSTFKPISIPAKTTIRIHQRIREFGSDNVVGKILGSDPLLAGQAVLVTAHWDHMGMDTTKKGDQIYNGALDNAAGVAALLELARAFRSAPKPPRRSVLFVATTGEEQDLLGAQYYAYHPVVPLDSTLADLDFDLINVFGKAKAVSAMGMEETTLGEMLAEAAGGQGRTAVPNPLSAAGGRYRTDRFALARLGVLGIILEGTQLVGKTPEEEARLNLDYFVNHYHQVTDTVSSGWDLTGATDDLKLMFELGWTPADGAPRPQWKAGSRHTWMFGLPVAK